MSKRGRKYKAKSFESAGCYLPSGRKDSSANIYETMLMSDAWHDLTDKQKALYVVCKSQYYGHRKPRQDYSEDYLQADECFYLQWHSVNQQGEQYRMYSDGNSKRFYRDMQALEAHGFIKKLLSGRSHKIKSVYKFDSKWIEWRPDGK